jgi:hypothetical protein
VIIQGDARASVEPMIIGIDPGLRCTGVAAFDGNEWAVLSIRPKAHDLVGRIVEICARLANRGPWDLAVIERPQVYRQGLMKGDPNDLVDLAVLVGALTVTLNAKRTLLPRPAQWKGQVPKEIHHDRIRKQVPGVEGSKDALDAVGLALWGSHA